MINDKFDCNEYPTWDPDALVEVTFSSRKYPVRNGYRPHYKVKDDYLTTTSHWFIDTGEALPNVPTKAFVKFITPEAYPHSLSPNMSIEVGEGAHIVGKAKILEIYNTILIK